jgi:hypothetical protein
MGSVLTDDVDDDVVAAGGGDGSATAASTDPPVRLVHRLRDLDRTGRIWAGVLALALLLAPVLAFAWATPEWVPTGDTAFMGLRALDVGTSRTPLIGQPSSSAHYVGAASVNHLGPTHFYLLAPAMRLFGSATGMLLVSLLIVSTCVLIAAWAVFRQLGPRAGVLAAVILGAITFTTGASSLVNPVSSNIAGYPLICSMILLWCLLCGDVRLLPLVVGVVSFAAQQHLSVVPGLALATGAAVAGFVWLRRRDPARGSRRELLRWSAISAAVAAVLWAPVVVQQLFGDKPNLSTMLTFAQHDDRPSLGPRSGVRQVVHVLGLPPLLGQREWDGVWLQKSPSPFTWVTAALVLVVVGWLGWRWRSERPRQAALALMVGVLAAAGVVNGSSVPAGVEQFRATFYHWAFALTFFVTLTVGLAVVGLVADRSPLSRRPWAGTLGAALAVLAVAVPSLVNPSLDRYTNTLDAAYSPVERSTIDQLADAVMAHRDQLGHSTVVVAQGDDLFVGVAQGLSLELAERGFPTLHTIYEREFVHKQRWAHRRSVDGGLFLVVEQWDQPEQVVDSTALLATKRPIAEVDPFDQVDKDALDRLVAEAHSVSTPRVGKEAEAAIKSVDQVTGAYYVFAISRLTTADAGWTLRSRALLELLRDHPIESPHLDRHLIQRVLDTLPTERERFHIRVYALDRAEIRKVAGSQIGE